MPLFPFFMDIRGADGLIVGGGKHALEKVRRLLPFSPSLRVIDPKPLPELETVPGIAISHRCFQESDLTPPPAFVVVSTGDQAEDRRISALCQAQRIPVNVVDDQPACTFVFPSLITRGNLSVGISTAGASPAAAVQLKRKVEEVLPDHTGDILDWLQSKRSVILRAIPDRKRRFAFHHRLTGACLTLDRPLTEAEFAALLAEETSASGQ